MGALLALVLVLVFPATSTAAGEFEPNDRHKSAFGPLKEGVEVSATLEGDEDTDWFFFYLPARSKIEIRVLQETGEADSKDHLARGGLCSVQESIGLELREGPNPETISLARAQPKCSADNTRFVRGTISRSLRGGCYGLETVTFLGLEMFNTIPYSFSVHSDAGLASGPCPEFGAPRGESTVHGGDSSLLTPPPAPPVIFVHSISGDACGDDFAEFHEAVAERFPLGDIPASIATPCDGEERVTNPLRFRYVRDKAGGGDQDVADGGSSQSGAGANARALRRYIDRLVPRYGEKAFLVGFSMGGLIIRTYLAQFPDEADEKIGGVAFVESAHQGSLLAPAAARLAHPDARGDCALVLGQRLGRLLCRPMLSLIRSELKLHDPDAIALRDLAPRSGVVLSNASSRLPPTPAYLNLPGNIRIAPPVSVGAWSLSVPGLGIDIGDGVIARGKSDPRGSGRLGGAGFDPALLGDEYDALEVELSAACKPRWGLLLNDYLSATATLARDLGTCVNLPQAHWKIAGEHASVEAGGMNLDRLVLGFLARACRDREVSGCP